MSGAERPYDLLTPDTVIAAAESLGFYCDGRILPLNSYENRVYQIGVEDAQPLIGKFYRPERWTDDSILEEHAFTLEIAAREVPAVAPLRIEGTTLHRHAGFRFAVFPRQGGRRPELETEEDRRWLGRYLGRIHALGRIEAFEHRPELTVAGFGDDSVRFLLDENWIPAHLVASYEAVAVQLLEKIRTRYRDAGAVQTLRLQGDCYPGNILWNDEGPHFVDFDDCRTGPAIQDLWMLLSGDREEMSRQLGDYLSGYSGFCEFDYRELLLLEALRTLRMLHYAAWLARRWDDPAFPNAFPWFDTSRYWEEHVLSLKEQLAALDEAPLSV